ncbi:cysteine desulfurase [Weissella viridescens]|uniref:Cysteine desulfurase n=1 Tax=Weissella viridescens TaxID=1629 RepID=A0A3P2R977_WEIVI|nr:cysteine desulfurase [Weissella viridescens]RRG17367.1 cysteine desulfurase [Weissella viridescens]
MAFEKQVTIPGDDQVYAISPNIKKYALTDTGFINKPNGTYVLERSLEPMKPVNAAITLKIVVNATLTGLKIKTLNPAGTIIINLFEIKDNAEMVKLYHYYIDDLIQRDVLVKVS